MIFHLDLGLGETIFCDVCEEELSNDVWIEVVGSEGMSRLCFDCSRPLATSPSTGGKEA